MKRLLMITVISITLGVSMLLTSAFAENYTVTSMGNFDFIHGSNGYSGTGTRMGSFYFYNDNR